MFKSIIYQYKIKQITTILFAIFLIPSFTAFAQPSALLSANAKAAFNKEDYTLAITELTKIIETQPGSEIAFVERARCNYLSVSRKELVDKVSAELAKKIKDRVQLNRAVEAFVNTKISSGMADAEKAISINPNNANTYNIRGLLKKFNWNVDGAIDDFSKAITLDKTFFKPYFNRAALYEKKNDFDAALKDYATLIALDSNDVIARRMRVGIHKKNGVKYVPEAGSKMYLAYIQMYDDLNILMYIDSTNEQVYQILGDLLTDAFRGEAFNCAWVYERYKRVKPNAAEAHFKYADAVAEANSDYTTGTKEEYWAKAVPAYEKAIALDNSKVDYYIALSNLYLTKINDNDKSLQIAQKLISKFPQEAVGQALAGNAYYQKSDFDNALKSFSTAIELSPDYTYAYLYRSRVYQQKMDVAKTLADFSKAIEINPKMADAYLARGNFYLYQKNAAEAIKDLTEAIHFKVSDPCAFVSRARAYMLQALANNEKYSSNENFKKAFENMERSSSCPQSDFYQGELYFLTGQYSQAVRYFGYAQASYEYKGIDQTEVNKRLQEAKLADKNFNAAIVKKSNEKEAANEANRNTSGNTSTEKPVNVYAQTEALKAYYIAMAKYNETTLEYNNAVARINADKVDLLFHKKAVLDKMYKKLDESENLCRTLWQNHGDYLPRKFLKQILDCMDECSCLKIGTSIRYNTFYKFYGFL